MQYRYNILLFKDNLYELSIISECKPYINIKKNSVVLINLSFPVHVSLRFFEHVIKVISKTDP